MLLLFIFILKIKFNIQKIYYIQNGIHKHFENSLKEYDNGLVHTINFLPQDYGFVNLIKMRNYFHFKLKNQILENVGLKEFDLIIDTQTRINNSLLIKNILILIIKIILLINTYTINK